MAQPTAVVVAQKRVYEAYDPADGLRVLVDRLWPRGLSKERAHVDRWLREVAPSPDLRAWFGHDPARFAEFRRRYEAELAADPARSALDELRELARAQHVTLVFAARHRTLQRHRVAGTAGAARQGIARVHHCSCAARRANWAWRGVSRGAPDHSPLHPPPMTEFD